MNTAISRLTRTLLLASLAVSLQPALSAKSEKDMVDYFRSSKKFAYLSDSIARINKAKLLREPGPYTFFVPENDAFDDLEYGKWVEVWKDQPRLNKILMRGLVRGHFDKESFQDGKTLSTISGGNLKIEKRDGKLWIGNARIVDTDLECSNGVVHVLSKFISKDADPRDITSKHQASKIPSTKLPSTKRPSTKHPSAQILKSP